MSLGTPESAILSAVIFNALIIPLLIPLSLRGVRYRPIGATALLRRNMLIYGLGGLIVPFVGIKADRPRRPQPARSLSARGADDDRGRYKIFLGMAAGVGKTYRMLQEGHAEAGGRPRRRRSATWSRTNAPGDERPGARAGGGAAPPGRRSATSTVEEMDLPALLARDPELALIDELAHTNAPGLEHEKRYEDIADVLAAGIDVFSTVNVQHLESLNDQVAELTGVRVRETVPDSVLGTADEVVLIDLTPEALIARLRAGKIYPGENIDAALNNFFRIENLAALREVSLRQVAEEVESKRLVFAEAEPVGTAPRSGSPPSAQGGRRAAARPGPPAAQLPAPGPPRLALGAAARHRPRPALGEAARASRSRARCERQVTALRQLASVLGATLLIEEHDDLVAAVARVVRERGTTYIMVGESEPAARPRRACASRCRSA